MSIDRGACSRPRSGGADLHGPGQLCSESSNGNIDGSVTEDAAVIAKTMLSWTIIRLVNACIPAMLPSRNHMLAYAYELEIPQKAAEKWL